MTPIFNTNRKYPKMHVWCQFGDSAQICEPYRADMSNFLEFWAQMANMTLKVKVNDLNF